MADTLAFSTFDVSSVSAPKACPLCTNRPASFEYRISTTRKVDQELHGYCCLVCAGNLLNALDKMQRSLNQQQDPDTDPGGRIN